jgi:hypothetical protein
MKRLSLSLVVLALFAGCSNDSPNSASPTKPTFTAEIRPSNEVPPITNAESTGSGNATVIFDVQTSASGVITGGTATFVVNLTGFPASTPINIAHIHQANAGATGGIVFSTSLVAGEVVLNSSGSGSFTKTGISPADVAIFQAIMNNPAGFYFNVHSTLNPGGVARGQLVRVQ